MQWDITHPHFEEVIIYEDDNGVDHPVCYFSKKFDKHQRNYSTIEKECLSLILALQHFQVYLSSANAPIVIFSDHNPLTFIHKMKDKNQRLLRWSLMLQEHNLDIRHIKGRDNIIPDTLSSIHVISPDLVGFSRFWASQPDCPTTSPVGPKSPDFSICLSQFFGNVPFLILR